MSPRLKAGLTNDATSRKAIRLLHLGLLASSLLVVGCGGRQAKVPSALDTVEGTAEGAFDQAVAGDLGAARTESAALATAWSSYRPVAVRDGATTATLAEVDDAVAAVTALLAQAPPALTAARAINAVSAPMPDLYALYHPKVPVAVLTLDYLGREVLLDALTNDSARASAHLDTLAETWAVLRPAVLAVHGTNEATDLDAVLEAGRAAVQANNATNLAAAARQELEVVDAVEVLFQAADAAD
jgi:hypothetical protein